ncbi:MAG: hypothetical protein HQL54_00245 [Magnetococcales bacterium]|nr:hypothetical protein [Magnetococcales bacterium]
MDRIFKFISIVLTGFCLFISAPSAVDAIEIAPRISDREIIESLAELKAEHKNIDQRFDGVDQRFDGVNQRFDGVDQRFEGVNQRFDGVNERFDGINERFKNVDQRFDNMEKRIDDLRETMLVMFGALVSLFIALFGYIAWDRRNMAQPLRKRLDIMEQKFDRELEINNTEGSMPRRLLEALRELASSDKKLANVLRSFSLL